jgi:hypothetical protein
MGRKYFTLFEHHREPLVSRKVFLRRMARCAGLAFLLLSASVFLGAAVYRGVEGFSWVDAVLNAVMVMTGLGLTDPLHTDLAKIFTSFYAIATAIVFYVVLGILFAPLIHRFLHSFHLDLDKAPSPD